MFAENALCIFSESVLSIYFLYIFFLYVKPMDICILYTQTVENF